MTEEPLSIFAPPRRPRLPVLHWTLMAVTSAFLVWLLWSLNRAVHMPGHSYSGPLQPVNSAELQTRDNLRKHVDALAGEIGERNIPKYDALVAASNYLRRELESYGYEVKTQSFEVSGREVANLSVEIRGKKAPAELLIVGAHYDSVVGTPGANDNASGVAAVLEMARLIGSKQFDRTVRFVFFTNEEPPYFQTETMGSLVYARSLRRENANVVGMISVETIGAYSDSPESQQYPAGLSALYPDKGNFIAFASDSHSVPLLRRAIGVFREHARIPSEGGAAPPDVSGVGWSDHWSFWQTGYKAIMVTDTAPFRYRYYHTVQDTPEKVDYDNVARVVSGLLHVVDDLAHRAE